MPFLGGRAASSPRRRSPAGRGPGRLGARASPRIARYPGHICVTKDRQKPVSSPASSRCSVSRVHVLALPCVRRAGLQLFGLLDLFSGYPKALTVCKMQARLPVYVLYYGSCLYRYSLANERDGGIRAHGSGSTNGCDVLEVLRLVPCESVRSSELYLEVKSAPWSRCFWSALSQKKDLPGTGNPE